MYSVDTSHLLVRLKEVYLLLRWVHDDANEYSSSYSDVCVFQVLSHELSRLKIEVFNPGVEDEELPTLLVDKLLHLTIQVLAEVLAAGMRFDPLSLPSYQGIKISTRRLTMRNLLPSEISPCRSRPLDSLQE